MAFFSLSGLTGPSQPARPQMPCLGLQAALRSRAGASRISNSSAEECAVVASLLFSPESASHLARQPSPTSLRGPKDSLDSAPTRRSAASRRAPLLASVEFGSHGGCASRARLLPNEPRRPLASSLQPSQRRGAAVGGPVVAAQADLPGRLDGSRLRPVDASSARSRPQGLLISLQNLLPPSHS